MIDVHVLTYEGTDPLKLERALASLREQTCTVHVIDNRGKPVGAGRARGYAEGEHEFVSFLDCDEWAAPRAIAVLAAAMLRHRAVCTLEKVVGTTAKVRHHHMPCYRRADIVPLIPAIAEADWCADILTMNTLAPTQLEVVGAFSEPHSGGTTRSRVTLSQFEKEEKLWRTLTAPAQ